MSEQLELSLGPLTPCCGAVYREGVRLVGTLLERWPECSACGRRLKVPRR